MYENWKILEWCMDRVKALYIKILALWSTCYIQVTWQGTKHETVLTTSSYLSLFSLLATLDLLAVTTQNSLYLMNEQNTKYNEKIMYDVD